MNKELIRFIAVGIFNTAHYFAWFVLFTEVFQVHYVPAHWTAFLISMVGSYFLNTLFTYRAKVSWRSFFQFPIVYVVQIIISTGLIILFTDGFGINEKISSLIASVGTIPFTFVLSRKIIKR
ncbi:GtrA family protein [Chryseomicrobium sp. FSL W7-1435]|uniref:GtrA family protein n=1 Tax=Chryseomicrobium sp. FSL W7-1435 TaxID=2921704 RepID=UPI00315A6A1D